MLLNKKKTENPTPSQATAAKHKFSRAAEFNIDGQWRLYIHTQATRIHLLFPCATHKEQKNIINASHAECVYIECAG
jgi:hypothetical protein